MSSVRGRRPMRSAMGMIGSKRRARVVPWLVLALLWTAPPASQAAIYRWTDASGAVHFTEELARVPARQRAAAEAAARSAPAKRRIQIYTPPASVRPRSRPGRVSASDRQRYQIRVERAGSAMIVSVEINGQLRVPFQIDTGASDVVLPAWAAKELGIDLSDARSGIYSTANGLVKQKRVQLDSVSLGGAKVEGVPATVSSSMRVGLLGLSYFNHFRYDIDPVRGEVTLVRNELAERGLLKGGRVRQQWRQEFAMIQARIAAMRAKREQLPESHTRGRREFDARVAQLEHELELLEGEADDAHVPYSWRE